MKRKLTILFVSAFALNLLWEEAHSILYTHHNGELITHLMLLRAALFDATVITLFSYPFLRFEQLKQKRWMLYLGLFIFAVILERWALLTGRWVYTDAMPIVPFLNIGLTPTIQLVITGCITLKISN